MQATTRMMVAVVVVAAAEMAVLKDMAATRVVVALPVVASRVMVATAVMIMADDAAKNRVAVLMLARQMKGAAIVDAVVLVAYIAASLVTVV